MQLETLRFGLLEIEDNKVIKFPQGLPGFEQHHAFVLLHPDPELPISYLQSVDDGYISFVVMDPFLVLPSYEFELSDAVKQELELTGPEEVSILAIVTIKDEIRNATINLKAPLVINTQLRIAKQVILHDYPYVTKHPLFATSPSSAADRG